MSSIVSTFRRGAVAYRPNLRITCVSGWDASALLRTLVKRANAQSGDSEVWQATASSILSSASVTSTPTSGGGLATA
jgi:hypothetical protein